MDKLKIIEEVEPASLDLESQWIAQAQQGDQKAFYALYEKYYRRIYALCWRMMADKDSAEDACQEVFVQLWQKISNFAGESKFSTWLHSVATHIVLNHIRKNKSWLQRIFSIEEQVLEDTLVEMPDTGHYLDSKIQQLPERARLVFVLFAIEGYRHEEIANMLDMAVGTSKAQYHRARNLLQASLSE
ncbi:RNA polymerase sigma factor [Colwellia chukchiensis]|uniref:RNA polymerase sigma factor n=1 Tax=Colwellia chukchiensis TaxID=641665 RepID=UPI001E4095C0|nr:RNA polymerase sigma factor [Colwellia chukchiensis]